MPLKKVSSNSGAVQFEASKQKIEKAWKEALTCRVAEFAGPNQVITLTDEEVAFLAALSGDDKVTMLATLRSFIAERRAKQ